MSSKKHLYLPKLVDANIDEPKEDGLWELKDQRIIQAISDGIEVGAEATTRGLSSIPDIYARPLTFQSALTNLRHPLRARVLQEWRGLLSLLALRELKDLNDLKFTPVKLGNDKLSGALRKLKPRAVELQVNRPAYEWTEFLLLQLDGISLGAFSPATLVFSSADYHTKLRNTTFPLRDAQGYLAPPTDPDDLFKVGEWLEWFYTKFRAFANANRETNGRDNPVVEVLNRELRTWLDEIKALRDPTEQGPVDAPACKPADEATRVEEASFLEQRALYKLLLHPLIRDRSAGRTGAMSEYALECSRKPASIEHVVVIDETLLGQDRLLWEGQRPSELGADRMRTFFSAPRGTTINRKDIGREKGEWIRPELYFLTPTLTRAAGAASFLPEAEARSNGGSARYLLPLRPAILQYFTVDEIIDKLQPRYTEENNRVVFSLRLSMGRGQSLLVKKAYLLKGASQAAGEGALLEREIPVLELFPNYLGEFWARYYLLASETEKLRAAPVHYSSDFYLSSPREQRVDNATERLRAEVTRISGVDCFPEAVALSERGTEEAVGLVLLKKFTGREEEDDLKENQAFTDSATFGIDFGTSNTNVFIKRGDSAEPLKLQFSKYLRQLTASPSRQREAITQAFFLPTKGLDGKPYLTLPTPTALRVYNPGLRQDLLLDYFIYFPDRYRYPENVLVDLKWEQESRVSLNNFLESLSFLLLVEAVRQRIGRIDFRCTYPKSFSPAREREYRERWNGALLGMFDTEGKAADLQHGHKLLYGAPDQWTRDRRYVSLRTNSGLFSIATDTFFATEGIAAGEFFSSKITAGIDRASPETGAVCIDVGGGTTDFSILYKGTIMYDASVMLAGKQIAEIMAQNSRIGEALLSRDANEALQQAKVGSKFASRMNFILRKEHKTISAGLAKQSGSDAIQPLRRVLMVEFGALAFYAGHLTLALNRFLKGELSSKVTTSGLKLHWGGNASKMLDWIDGGKFQQDGDGAARLLNNLFGNVVTNKELVEADRIALKSTLLGQRQSTGHKNEAAGGVVVMSTAAKKSASITDDFDEFDSPDDTSGATAGFLEGLVMGERITLSGRTYEPHHVFSAADVVDQYSSRYEDTNLEQLDQFLKVLNHLGVKYGGITPDEVIELSAQDRLTIRNNVRSDFAEQASKEPTDRNLEPVFIVEVRYLLDIMLKRML